MRIGFIGLGDMGLPMARRLLATGHSLVAWNRSAERLQTLAQEGAQAVGSPAEVMTHADLIGLCVTSDRAVHEIVSGPRGLFSVTATRGQVVADFSTGSPEAAMRFASLARECGAAWVDVPVSGGVPAACSGALIAFAGGDAEAIAALNPLLNAVVARVSHMGPSGSGQATKICNQMIVACTLLVIGESIGMARKIGVQVERLPEAFMGGFADSAPLQIFGRRMAEHWFEPRLGAIALMEKDVELAGAMAERVHAHTPMLSLARSQYSAVHSALGLDGTEDISRIIGLFEEISPKPRAFLERQE